MALLGEQWQRTSSAPALEVSNDNLAPPPPPEGWYPDPNHRQQLRWWSGSRWTDATRVGDSTTPAPDVATKRDAPNVASAGKRSEAQPKVRTPEDKKFLAVMAVIGAVTLLAGVAQASPGFNRVALLIDGLLRFGFAAAFAWGGWRLVGRSNRATQLAGWTLIVFIAIWFPTTFAQEAKGYQTAFFSEGPTTSVTVRIYDGSDKSITRPADGTMWGGKYDFSVKLRIDGLAANGRCNDLQSEFDTAYANDGITRDRTGSGTADLMAYIDQALDRAGCYG